MASSDDEEALIQCGTTKGDITLHLIREWSPNGYDKAVELYERHFYDNSHFFRAVPNFLVQFGISYSKDKELQHFAKKSIQDDPKHDPPIEFHPGIISYAGSGPNSRSSQMFFSYGSSSNLGRELWETPIGKVIEGMDVAEQFYSYGDMPPWGKGPVQGKIYNGPQYIEENFPLIDHFLECTVTRSGGSDSVDLSADSGSNDGDDRVADMENHSTDDDAKSNEERKFGDDDAENNEGGDKDSLDAEALSERRLVRLGKSLRSNADSHPYRFPAVMILVVGVLYASLRRRRKVSGKMN